MKAAGYSIGLVVLLAVMYVLSGGPFLYLRGNGWVPGSSDAWRHFYTPLGWLLTETPLHDPLHAYLKWWDGLIDRGP
jgi:hypothetical protein